MESIRILAFEPADNVGAYWVRDSCEALMGLGHTVEVIQLSPPHGKPLWEIIHRVKESHPDYLFTINHIGLIPELLKIIDIPIASWFIDDPFRYLKREDLSKDCIIFVCDRFYIKRLKEFGFKRVHYLPGATNPEIFKPIELNEEEKKRYGCNISFVGNSIYHALLTFKRYRDWLNDDARDVVDKALELQMENHLLDIHDILNGAQRAYGSFLSYPGLEHVENVRICIEFAAMSLYRKGIIEGVADLGLRLFGDEGWERLLDGKVKVEGEIDYRREVPLLYNASKINLNITKTQLKTTLNQRVFDVSACGGFLLTDYRRDLGEFFNIGEEVIYYKDKDELRGLVEYFLFHEDERMEIAKRARKRVLAEHTFSHRMDKMIEVMRAL